MESKTTETTTTVTHGSASRRAAVNGLAVVGFVALIILGIGMAVYAARYVPQTIARMGSANVYFASLFDGDQDTENTKDEDPGLVIVPGDEIPFEDEETPAKDEDKDEPKKDEDTKPTTPTTPTPKPTTTVIAVPGGTATYYGDPDLVVEIVETGYLRTTSTDSFVKADVVPDGKRPAFKFRVTNVGTNRAGSFVFEAKLPTSPAYTYESKKQQSLAPNQHLDFVLGFDRSKDGEQRVTVTIDTEDDVKEGNERNNSDSVVIEIED